MGTKILAEWGKFAANESLRLDPDGFAVSGIFNGLPVRITLKNLDRKFNTKFHFQYGVNLACGLKIIPENSVHRALSRSGVQDVQIGIAAFDEKFIVKATNTAKVKRMLSAEVCSQFLILTASSTSFEINDNEMHFYFAKPFDSESELRSMTTSVFTIASSLIASAK